MSLLQIETIAASYGAVEALSDVSLTLAEGEVLALMGRNGMGKSTTIRALCRMMPVTRGQIRFAGQDLLPQASHQAARAGIGLVPEGRRCFAPLSVTENLTVAARPGAWDLAR
ncbi:ATP-binding cassette domain-containing protein, partial [Pseudogemmobacter faecipullorum]